MLKNSIHYAKLLDSWLPTRKHTELYSERQHVKLETLLCQLNKQ